MPGMRQSFAYMRGALAGLSAAAHALRRGAAP